VGRIYRELVPGALALLLGACTAESRPNTVLVLGAPDTLISTDQPWLAEAVDLVVSDSGVVYILDRTASRVFRLDENGRPMSPLGRRGSGPGEFQNPTAMGIGDDVIWVLDRGNGRLLAISYTGSTVASEPLGARPLIPTSHVDGEGNLLVATLGRHGTLVRQYSRGGRLTGEYGTPIGEPLLMFDPSATQDAIRQGQVPGVMRNQVTPLLGHDGEVWLFLETEGTLVRYSSGGALEAQFPLQCPEFEAARREFFRRNREEPLELGVVPLRYSTDMDLVDGEVWILLQQDGGQSLRILAVDRTTGSTRRITVEGIQGATQVAIDEKREWLFALVSSEAELLRVSLSGTGALRPGDR
jgi:hypothetical protein